MESYGTNPAQKKDDMYGAHGTTGGGHQAHGVTGDQSEDDGMGGRRKKGLKEKIKEKLPGHDRKTDEHVQEHGTAATTTGARGRAAATTTAGHEETAEKKGMMEKIKEKLPGANR
ncbi:uncharacterized protein A4U43_C01F3740 [Asparagus officinalis]|uniref:Dehydrin n=1 Tax=Asparagus officinalis TaxID=4686 RepID=A0A5P1FR79_ASPOF|nr:uncharacterized protein A4U43_C01F3740 [Asparagus officinalis]